MIAKSEPIDIIMCTWNSNKPWFRKCLLSIRRQVDVCHFIVVDKYSYDDTVSVIKSIFPDAVVIQTNANLAVARAVGIRHVDTKYFAFIDDDVQLCKDWLTKLIRFIRDREGVGAVQGFTRYYIDYLDKCQIFGLRHLKEPIQEITQRGNTHKTLVLIGFLAVEWIAY